MCGHLCSIQLNRVDDSTADGWLQPDVPGGAVPVLSYSGYLRAWGEDFVRDLVLEGLVPTQDDGGPSEVCGFGTLLKGTFYRNLLFGKSDRPYTLYG